MKSASSPSILHMFLIKPSRYDDDGFVVRHWRGVLPSNTLACLHGLTEDVRARGQLGDVDIRVHLLDETVDKIPVRQIVRLNRHVRERVVVALVGVQTNQFACASDLALELRRKGVSVLIGGFHVSGMLAMFPSVTPEIQQLVDAGVTVVAGEVEDRWAELLQDALVGNLKPIYRFLNELPDLSKAPRPIINKEYLRKFVSSNFGTIDCSRGCPFNCSFCTIINVQGRKSRHRSPECLAETIRQNYRESGVYMYFFTDDDFARNPGWEGTFDQLIGLRENEGIPIKFMIQVDVQSFKIPRFVEKAARAGCSSVFIGMESINPRNLKEAGKSHNKVQEYRDLIEAWHRARVSTQVGYIIGFPQDTEESVRDDVERLMNEVRVQRASFFMMAPLPGSQDHKRMVEDGTYLDADFNSYDCFHESMPHPRMKNGAWTRAYSEAWHRFYSFEHMKEVLCRADAKTYWDIFRNYLWCKNSFFNEGAHPMITGFFRIKDRKTRRGLFPRESRFAHIKRRVPEVYRYARSAFGLLLEMEELWLQTRKRSETELRVIEEMARMRTTLRRSLRVSELQAAYAQAKAQIPSIQVPSRLSLFMKKLSVTHASRLRETRDDLSRYWAGVRQRVRQGRIEVLLRVDRMGLNVLREVRLTTGFLIALATGTN